MTVYVPVSRSPAAPVRLSRSGLATKIGGDRKRYPRAGGVVVPALLADCCREELALQSLANQMAVPLSGVARRRLGRAVVLELTRTLRQLPPEIIEAALPHPAVALSSLPLEDRTRNALERLLPLLVRRQQWTMAHYLEIPGFGARCIIDLLAAIEEFGQTAARGLPASRDGTGAQPPAPAHSPNKRALRARNAEDLTARLNAHLPMALADLGTWLFRQGEVAGPLAPAELTEFFRRLDAPVPFQIVRAGGMEIAISITSRGVMATAAAAAIRLASIWGVLTAEMVADRVAVLCAAPVTVTMIKRLLLALPRLRWLDDRQEWFAFSDDTSPLGEAVRKVFRVAERVDQDVLLQALAKGASGRAAAPGTVLRRYLSEIASCEFDGPHVRSRAAVSPAALTEAEATLVDLLRESGRQTDLSALRRSCEARHLGWSAASRLIRTSPLFVKLPRNRVGLLGAPPSLTAPTPA